MNYAHRRRSILSLTHFLLLRSSTNPNPKPNPFLIHSFNHIHSLPSNHSGNLHQGPPFSSLTQPVLPLIPNPNSNFNQSDFRTISDLLNHPNLKLTLAESKIEPNPTLLLLVFDHFGSSLPKLMLVVFLWAEKNPNYQFSIDVFNSLIKLLAKAREFESAWSLIVDRIGTDHGPDFNSFAVLIRRYVRAGMVQPAIQTYEYASNLDFIRDSNLNMNMLEILLSSFCTRGLVKVASGYFDRKRLLDPCWDPSTKVYNILLNGWFRARKHKNAEQLWVEMRKSNIKPSVVTYGILVEGCCRMHQVEIAFELVSEMKREGISPNAIIYNPIIDALSEAGKFEEALGMMEHFAVSESGPDICTYNSLVKGFCKAGDLVGASKILKMMINRGCLPTCTTYNYFFWHFKKYGKIEEGLNLYNKMIESGHIPDGLTYRLLLKMLCEQERVNLATEVLNDMRSRGCNLDSTTNNRLIHLMCKVRRFDDAFREIEDMTRRGVIPWFLTYQILRDELNEQGMTEMTQKVCVMMTSVPHLLKLPHPSCDGDLSHRRGTSIMRKVEAMNDISGTSRNANVLIKHRGPLKNIVVKGQRANPGAPSAPRLAGVGRGNHLLEPSPDNCQEAVRQGSNP